MRSLGGGEHNAVQCVSVTSGVLKGNGMRTPTLVLTTGAFYLRRAMATFSSCRWHAASSRESSSSSSSSHNVSKPYMKPHHNSTSEHQLHSIFSTPHDLESVKTFIQQHQKASYQTAPLHHQSPRSITIHLPQTHQTCKLAQNRTSIPNSLYPTLSSPSSPPSPNQTQPNPEHPQVETRKKNTV